jgi:glycosyltransferase involved in cell wall biosynthesis
VSIQSPVNVGRATARGVKTTAFLWKWVTRKRRPTRSIARVGVSRIVIIVQNLPVPRDRRVWRECRALQSAGYEVSVVCPKAQVGDPAFEELEGVRLYRYKPLPSRGQAVGFLAEYAYSWARTALLVTKISLREGFDVIQACNPPDIFFTVALAFKMLGKRFVYDQHDLCPELYLSRFDRPSRLLLSSLRWLEKASYAAADRVIVTNESHRLAATTRGAKDADRIAVVRNGPEIRTMRKGTAKPALRKGRTFLCCYLGMMGPQDGVDLALLAAAHYVHGLRRDDCSFAFLGAGEAWDDLRELAEDLEISRHVSFTGWAEDQLAFAYLSTADVGLSPEPKNELNDASTMMKVTEYMAFELPIVAFDLKETRVTAGGAAAYVCPNDVEAYAVAIAALLDDPTRRRRMAVLGKERIRDRLSWEAQAPTYVGVFDELVGPRPRANR